MDRRMVTAAVANQPAQETTATPQWRSHRSSLQDPSLMRTASSWCKRDVAGERLGKEAEMMCDLRADAMIGAMLKGAVEPAVIVAALRVMLIQ